jgi:hypothetical protein
MKNWLNLVTKTLDNYISHMTGMQRLILIGSIILPGGSLILIFSRYGRRIIRELMKARTSRTYGNWINITQKDIDELYERTETE